MNWGDRMKDLVIIGTGAMADDVKTFVNRYKLFNIVGYACNDDFLEISKKQMPNENVIAISHLDDYYDKNDVCLFVAISQLRYLNRDRRETFLALKKNGWKFATLISPTAKIYPGTIGEGSWIMDDVYLGNQVVVGENTIISNQAYISHYDTIGSHVYISGRALLMGTVKIGDSCFIGGNATIFNNVTVGNKCIVGGYNC